MRGWRSLRGLTEEAVILGLAVFLFLVATNTQTGWLYGVVALLVASLGVGFLGPRAALKGLEVTRTLPATARQGQTIRVGLEVRNPARTPRDWVIVEEPLWEDPPPARPRRFLVERVPARGSARITYPLTCALRGVYALPPALLESRAPLGLFPARREAPTRSQPMLVYPVGPELGRAQAGHRDPSGQPSPRTLSRRGSSTDLHGIRPYTPGEDTRSLHWPASARTGSLMIREFRQVAGQGLAVLIDNEARAEFGIGTESSFEQMISAAASLVSWARLTGSPLALVSGSPGGLLCWRGQAGDPALAFLARLLADGRPGWPEALQEAASRIPAGSRALLLTSRPLGDPLALAPLRSRRAEVSVLYFEASSFLHPSQTLPSGFSPGDYQESVQALTRGGHRAWIHRRGQSLAASLRRVLPK